MAKGNIPCIGIPRALLYYEYYPMWKTFWESLGAEVVVSPPTTKYTLASGSCRVAETCLPVKVFIGHVIYLSDKCDYMFIPAVHSMERNIHNCAKFLGLPDMTKAAVPECPPILDIDIDMDKGKRELYQAIYKLARPFTWNPFKVKRAAEAAWQAHQSFQARMRRYRQPPIQAIEEMFNTTGKGVNKEDSLNHPTTIALIGHPYLLYDDYVNHRLLPRLKGMGARVVSPEMVAEEEIDAAIATLVGKAYWTYEGEVVGAGGYFLQSEVNGVIGLVAFGCGPDSMMMGVVQRYARKRGKPFIWLTLDEHTSETGLLTRLEAFLDMINRRKCAR